MNHIMRFRVMNFCLVFSFFFCLVFKIRNPSDSMNLSKKRARTFGENIFTTFIIIHIFCTLIISIIIILPNNCYYNSGNIYLLRRLYIYTHNCINLNNIIHNIGASIIGSSELLKWYAAMEIRFLKGNIKTSESHAIRRRGVACARLTSEAAASMSKLHARLMYD